MHSPPKRCFYEWASALLLVAAVSVGAVLAAASDSELASTEPGVGSRDAVIHDFPLYFIENRGQLEEPVGFYLEGREASVYFAPGAWRKR